MKRFRPIWQLLAHEGYCCVSQNIVQGKESNKMETNLYGILLVSLWQFSQLDTENLQSNEISARSEDGLFSCSPCPLLTCLLKTWNSLGFREEHNGTRNSNCWMPSTLNPYSTIQHRKLGGVMERALSLSQESWVCGSASARNLILSFISEDSGHIPPPFTIVPSSMRHSVILSTSQALFPSLSLGL